MDLIGRVITFVLENAGELLQQTHEHLLLTGIALAAATLLAVPLGVYLQRNPRWAGPIIGFTGVLQTIPSLAMLGLFLPILGIGTVPAVVTLFLYSLLPIVRNTFTGIDSVDSAVTEAAQGMGMSKGQVLRRVELPLAMPVIFAGVRTAAVIGVGIATLGAFIAAGGLGTYIFRGLSLNNTVMIVAGALPAAALALVIDGLLGLVQKRLRYLGYPFLAMVLLYFGASAVTAWLQGQEGGLRIGMQPEFVERRDGYKGLREAYSIDARVVEIEHGLMYRALHNGRVDAVVGYSTDGEIAAYDLVVLEDNLNYFPPYYVAPLVRRPALDSFPELAPALNLLENRIDNKTMARLNARVDQDKLSAATVAYEFLTSLNLGFDSKKVPRGPGAQITVGSKKFAESMILAEMFALLIENRAGLKVDLKTGLGGTKIAFAALRRGDIDLYPEYTGTGLLAILKTPPAQQRRLVGNKDKVYEFVRRRFRQKYNLQWLKPTGFNNTYALIVRREATRNNELKTIEQFISSF